VKIRHPYWLFWSFLIVAVAVPSVVWTVREIELRQEERVTATRARIERLQSLVTTRYRYRDIVFFERETRLLGIPSGSQEILFAVEMEIHAGVNLGRGFTVEMDPADPARVYITLPAAEVLRVDADEESINQYLIRERLSRIDWLDVADELEAAKERNRQDAVERGILQRAEVQTRSVVAGLARAAGFRAAEVRFRPGEDPDEGELRG
jgi:hypothetical protein